MPYALKREDGRYLAGNHRDGIRWTEDIDDARLYKNRNIAVQMSLIKEDTWRHIDDLVVVKVTYTEIEEAA